MINEDLYYSDFYLQNILENTKTIAIVGLSSNSNRPSFFAASYLKSKGYKIIPINPSKKGTEILGEKVYASLSDLNHIPDMVDIFRKSIDAEEIAEQAIKIKTKTIWMQLGVRNDKVAKLAKKNNINIVMNRCPKIEYARLTGELGWFGINTEIITNKKRMIRKANYE